MRVRGACSRMALMQSAKCCAPPSRRSSRSTLVTTTYFRPMSATVVARLRARWRPAASAGRGRRRAERAAARANLAEDHEGRGAVAEALVDVRATGLFADRDQAVLPQLGLEVLHRVAGRDAHADPRGLAQLRHIGELHRRAVDLVPADLLDAGLQGRGRGTVGRDRPPEEWCGQLAGSWQGECAVRPRGKVGQSRVGVQFQAELAGQFVEQHRAAQAPGRKGRPSLAPRSPAGPGSRRG